MHKFVIMIRGKIQVYTNYEDIPDFFDHVIEFMPEIPPPPHTEEQHIEIEQWNDKLQALMKRCKY